MQVIDRDNIIESRLRGAAITRLPTQPAEGDDRFDFLKSLGETE